MSGAALGRAPDTAPAPATESIVGATAVGEVSGTPTASAAGLVQVATGTFSFDLSWSADPARPRVAALREGQLLEARYGTDRGNGGQQIIERARDLADGLDWTDRETPLLESA